jgi:hypothetical protein
MTEEEAAYWDDYYTKNPPKVDPTKKGWRISAGKNCRYRIG